MEVADLRDADAVTECNSLGRNGKLSGLDEGEALAKVSDESFQNGIKY